MSIKNILKKFKRLSFFDTFKHASTYFSGTILIHGLGVITLPVFTALLTTEEYGIINVFTSYISVLIILLSFYIHGAISRYYFEKDKDDFSAFLGSSFLFCNISFITLGYFVFLFRIELAKIINLPSELIFCMILMSYLTVCYYFFQQVMIATKQSKKYTFTEVTWQYLKFLITVCGLLYLSDTYFMYNNVNHSYTFMGKIIGEIIASVFIVAYTTKVLFRYLSFSGMKTDHIKYALSYSIPLIPFALSSFILTSFDQWYINSAVGQAEAGQYAFAYKIGVLFLGLITALLNGSQPEYFKFMNDKHYAKVSEQVNSVAKLLMLGAGFIILFAVDVGTLLSSKKIFLEALPVAPVIVVAYIFHGVSSLYNRGIYYTKKNVWLALIVLLSGVLNIFLNLWFIPLYGFTAAAYTTLVSYFFMMLLSVFVTTFILKLPALPLGRIIKYIVLLTSVVSLNYFLGQPDTGLVPLWIAFKLGLFCLLGTILFFNKIGIFFNK